MIDSADSVSGGLLAKFRESLGKMCAADRIKLCAPYQKQSDYIMGIYLYDIRDFSDCQPMTYYSENKTEQSASVRMPPKLLELSYMIFINQGGLFGETDERDGQRLLTEAIRSVYEFPFVGDNKEIKLSFAFLSADSKIRLWQAFTKPLQPAVYINAAPLAVMPYGAEQVPVVKNVKLKGID